MAFLLAATAAELPAATAAELPADDTALFTEHVLPGVRVRCARERPQATTADVREKLCVERFGGGASRACIAQPGEFRMWAKETSSGLTQKIVFPPK